MSHRGLSLAEKALYHQIHPAKLATDVVSSIVSLWLLWRHALGWGLAVTFVPPIVASALLVRFGRLERLRDSAFGRYVGLHMTPAVQGVRVLGAVVMAIGAWQRSWVLVVVGFAVVIAAWTWGLRAGSRRPIG